MGRPRKLSSGEQMVQDILNNSSSQEKTEVPDNVGNLVQELPVFTHVAITIIRDELTGYPTYIEIPINGKLQLGVPKAQVVLEGMDEARDLFKKTASQKIL